MKITLATWSKKYGIKPIRHKGGAMYVPMMVREQSHRDLFNLSDHKVSSVTSGTVWLISFKEKEKPMVSKSKVNREQIKKKIIDDLCLAYERIGCLTEDIGIVNPKNVSRKTWLILEKMVSDLEGNSFLIESQLDDIHGSD